MIIRADDATSTRQGFGLRDISGCLMRYIEIPLYLRWSLHPNKQNRPVASHGPFNFIRLIFDTLLRFRLRSVGLETSV